MTQTQVPPPETRRRAGWLAVLVLDTALGYLAALPIYFIGSGVAHMVSERLGLGYRGYWGSEGAGMAVFGGIVFLVPVLLLVVAVNEPLRRWLRVPARRYWPIAAGLLLLPFPLGYLWNTLLG